MKIKAFKSIFFASVSLATMLCHGQGITNKGTVIRVLGGTSIHVNGDYVNDTKYPSEIDESQLILLTSTSALNITGNLVNNGPLNIVEETISAGPINFIGTSHQVSGTSSPPLITVPDVTFNGSLTLQHNLTIINSITLNGSLDLGNSVLDLKNTGLIVGETNTNRISTNGTGTIKYVLPATPILSDVLGQIGVRLEGPILSGASINRGHLQQAAADGSINRYFDIQLNAGDEIQQLTFHYFDNEIPVMINEADLVVYISSDGGAHWQKIGGIVNTTSNFIALTGLAITNSVRVTLASKNCSVPPTVNLGTPSQNFCEGVSKVLDAGNAGSSFFWSTSETTQTIATIIAGNYTVLVRDPKGCEGNGAVTLVERPMPVPLFTAGVPCPNLPVGFNNTSTIASGAITYGWDFGDPLTTADNSTSQNPSYAYPLAGDYPASLTVTSDYNCVAVLTQTVTVFPLPQLDFTVINACFGQTTTFNNTSTIASGGMTFDWDFGDGTNSTQASPTKSFPSISNFNITLTATSNANCISVLSRNIGIYPTPIADFSLNNVCEGINAPFLNISSIVSGTMTYQWNFGDATNSTSAVPLKSYPSSGFYAVTLLATSDFNCTNQITKPIEIYPNPVANFVVIDNCQDQVFNFTNTSTSALGAMSFAWDFDDTTLSTATDPSKSYSLPGTFNVALLATTSLGCFNSVVKPLIVFPVPQADFTMSNACQDKFFNFVNTSSVATGFLTYDWDFGDSNTSTNINPSTNYAAAGTYPITLKATSDKGCTNTKIKPLDVYPLPILDFGGLISTCGTTYNLDAENPGSTYSWSDGSTSRTLTAQSDGTYSVAITTVHNCVLRESANITLNGNVVPNLGPDNTVCGSQQLDAGYPGSSYLWSDGSTTRRITAVSSGSYSVTVTDPNGCVGTDNIILVVNPVPIVNFGPDIASCSDQPIVLDAQNSGSNFLWSDNSTGRTLEPKVTGNYGVTVTNSFGCSGSDNIRVTVNSAPENKLPIVVTACDKYTLDAGNSGSSFVWSTNSTAQRIDVINSGVYSVTITTPKNCSKQFTSNVTINSSPPVNLGADPSLCFGQSASLDAGATGDIYRWSDDSNGKTLIASKTGLYWVDVRKLNGCFTRDSVFVTIHPEITNTLKSSYRICANEQRVLDATSTQGVRYDWFNTKGPISSQASITANGPDKYWVITKDIFNCTVADTVDVTNDPDPITARFLVPSFVNVGDSVRFVQLSYPDPISFNWDFADGLVSAKSDPVHRYLRTGDFNSSLMVKDSNDCSDSKSKVITVRLLREAGETEFALPFVEWTKQSIYPNPTNELLNLELEFNQEVQLEVVLCAMDGKIMMSKDVTVTSGVIEFDIRALPSGMYILKLMKNRTVKQLRFIKI